MKPIFAICILTLFLTACGGGNGDQSVVAHVSAPPMATQILNVAGKRADFVIKKTSTGYELTNKISGSSQQIVGAPLVYFDDVNVNLNSTIKATSISANDLTNILELYVAFFNRVPDAEGLNYWIDQFKAGASIDEIANHFYEAAIAYTNLTGYSASMSNTDFISIIYKNVLGRDQVDSDGLDYWNAQLATKKATRANLIKSILSSAHSFKGDVTWGWVADLLDNKIALSKYFAINLGLSFNTSEESISKGMEIARAVTPTGINDAKDLIGIYDEGYFVKLSNSEASTALKAQSDLNVQGALGYLYLGDYALSNGIYSQYVKNLSKPTTYSYEFALFQSNVTSALTLMNERGSKGSYMYGTYYFSEGSQALFIHDNNNTHKFTYKANADVSSSQDFISKSNSDGKLGFRFVGSYMFSDGIKLLYVSENISSANFDYQLVKVSDTSNAFVLQANAMGKNGYRYTGSYAFSDGIFAIYIKDQSRNDTFVFEVKPMLGGIKEDSSAFLKQVNSEGGRMNRFLGTYYFSDGFFYIFSSDNDYIKFTPFGA